MQLPLIVNNIVEESRDWPVFQLLTNKSLANKNGNTITPIVSKTKVIPAKENGIQNNL